MPAKGGLSRGAKLWVCFEGMLRYDFDPYAALTQQVYLPGMLLV